MAENPLIIKKNDEKYATSREEFLAKSSKNILDKKGFIFKSYKTDRERINQIIKDKNELDKYMPKTSRHKQKIIDWGENKLIQPSMRFTARCDLERVYDVLKERELLFTEQKIVNAQMTKMGFASHNIEDYDEESDSNTNNNNDTNKDNNENTINEYKYLSEEEKNKKLRHNKIIQDRKMMLARRNLHLGISNDRKNKKDNENNNANVGHYAKQLREELYRRTHFKAMENLTMFKTSTMDHNIFKIWSKEDKKHQKKLKRDKKLFYLNISKHFKNALKESKDKSIKKHKNENSKNHKNMNTIANLDIDDISDGSGIGWGENKKIFKDVEINRELMTSNPLLYNLNFNSLKGEEKKYDALCKNKIKTLKKIAFEKENSREESFGEYEGFGADDLKKEENILIDGKYYKKSDTDLIADKLLTKCNWNEKKNKYHKQFGNGKLMFTGGLTLNEFQTKYGIFS
jgi:hypothetical protein